MEIHVVAKQWMWKTQHPGGAREIDALHVPVNRSIRLLMNSEDVIHSFYVPAFRIKQDVVPGATEQLLFKAVKTGTYRLTCAEYCGTRHSEMTGKIVVMEPQDFAKWLAEQPEGDALAERGAALYTRLGCSGCHEQTGTIRAPDLHGIYGKPVPLSDGRVVTADDAYIRDSILEPRKDVVAGFAPIMPSFAGKASESDLLALLAWFRTNDKEDQGE
jgi:cytochrome c oxidase subunit 2